MHSLKPPHTQPFCWGAIRMVVIKMVLRWLDMPAIENVVAGKEKTRR